MADEWFKCWHELRSDAKLEIIAERMEVPEPLVHGLWIDLLCLAHELDEDWHLRLTESEALSTAMIARRIHTDAHTAKRFMDEAGKLNMLVQLNGSLMIANAAMRNRKPSDTPSAWRERQARHRAKNKPVDNLPVDNSMSQTMSQRVTPPKSEQRKKDKVPDTSSNAMSRPQKRDVSRPREEEKRRDKDHVAQQRDKNPVDNSPSVTPRGGDFKCLGDVIPRFDAKE